MNRVADLQKENALLRAQLAERDAQISVLNEQLKKVFKKRFGASSEKTSPDQLGLFNEAEDVLADDIAEPEATPVKGHTRTRKPRVSIPDHFPREEIIHDIPESEKVCPHDGSTLKNIDSDDHEQLDIVPATIKVIRHKRLKFACPCCALIVAVKSWS
ncbi:IS66 family transposase zinc-finger binding domain-containing protein [Teredinibacter turnerae]|uniref:IS66 family transposase n=1 Tax=Teredinibacter turnerae TaxID=2426 RepID=UPI0004077799|nr:IS66 family transposase zinc-finger binding domain-containing protein [Teredinibacter turnerae]